MMLYPLQISFYQLISPSHVFYSPLVVTPYCAAVSRLPFISFEEEADSLTQQVLDEIGIDFASQVANPSRGALPARDQGVSEKDEIDDLESRLAALKG
mmetsp:Transcript_47477/g.148494  ORF Transcript_47477/g.148494 Transcript_47477/m.148494 type:complete len:98 (+) Transcript_47477:1760-2053(+)